MGASFGSSWKETICRERRGVVEARRAGRIVDVRLDGRMLVGLTGGIGAGKSVVAARLAELGAVVIDSDRLAREVVAPGTDGLAEVVAAFGPEIVGPDGALDRPALGRLVFGDPAARERLEKNIPPRGRARAAPPPAAPPEKAAPGH